ncbi:glucosyltransferase domain-containing protein [Escherichia coli]
MKRKQYFSTILTCTMLFVLPIIIANVYYIDDNYRSITGDDAWHIDGRPLSDLLMYIVNGNTHLTDTSPLPTFISIILLSVSGYSFSKRYIGFNHGVIPFTLIPLCIFASPFFIENVVYKFDVLPMCASISLSYLFINVSIANRFLKLLCLSVIVTCILSSYQASINFLLSLVLCEFLSRYNNNVKNLFSFIIETMASLCIGAFIYLKIILPIFLITPESSDHPMLEAQNIIGVAYSNSLYYLNLIWISIPESWRYIYLLLFAMSIICAICIAIIKKENGITGLILCLIAGLSPIISVLCSFISLSTLSSPLPFPRVMIGFSGTCLFIAMVIFEFTKSFRAKVFYILAIPVWFSFGMYYSYGNALRASSDITDAIFNNIKDDVFSLTKKEDSVILFHGATPKSKVLLNSIKNYPIIGGLVPDYLTNWTLPYTYMSRIGISYVKDYSVNADDIINNNNFCSNSDRIERYNYNVLFFDDISIIDFSKELCR